MRNAITSLGGPQGTASTARSTTARYSGSRYDRHACEALFAVTVDQDDGASSPSGSTLVADIRVSPPRNARSRPEADVYVADTRPEPTAGGAAGEGRCDRRVRERCRYHLSAAPRSPAL